MTTWIERLPPEMRPEHRRCFVEASSPKTKALMVDWLERRAAALESGMEFAEAHGAVGVCTPLPIHSEPNYATAFLFDEKPSAEAGWKTRPRRASDKHYVACPNKRTSGRVLRFSMSSQRPWPGTQELIDELRLIPSISHGDSDHKSGGWGFSSIGGIDLAKVCWTKGHYFVVFANPMKTLAEVLSNYPNTAVRGEGFDGDPADWRPPKGWKLLSEAKVELIFAEAKVRAEQQRTAA